MYEKRSEYHFWQMKSLVPNSKESTFGTSEKKQVFFGGIYTHVMGKKKF